MAGTRRAVPPVRSHADKGSTGCGDARVPPDDEFLSVGDVAQRLKVHPQTVRGWIARGELRAIRIGRTVRVRRTDFDDMLEGARIGAPFRTGSPESRRGAAERGAPSDPRAGD
jgi:excisionase family DNA binding protein